MAELGDKVTILDSKGSLHEAVVVRRLNDGTVVVRAFDTDFIAEATVVFKLVNPAPPPSLGKE